MGNLYKKKKIYLRSAHSGEGLLWWGRAGDLMEEQMYIQRRDQIYGKEFEHLGVKFTLALTRVSRHRHLALIYRAIR